MKDIVVIGAGGFGREVAQLIYDINTDKKTWNMLGFIDETAEKEKTVVNDNVVLGNFSWFEKNYDSNLYAICAIGNPRAKYSVIRRIFSYGISFPNLVHPEARVGKFLDIGQGNVICSYSFISVNVKMGNHIAINPGCGIGHDTIIGDYASLYWNVTLSGYVRLGEGCEIGSKASVIPKKIVGNWSIIGAGAVVIDDVPGDCTAVGVPARPVKFHHPESE